jgi:aspartyl-tRNA(Asn)/glutamyl-tRNA(Gln) amidotransferase subunit C
MISRKEVEHISKLARLGLSRAEIAKCQKELAAILDYMEKLRGLDTSLVEATSHPLKAENITRKDEPKPEKRKLIAGFLKVKSVFK